MKAVNLRQAQFRQSSRLTALCVGLFALGWSLFFHRMQAAEPPEFRSFEAAYHTARTAWTASPTNSDRIAAFARSAFEWAEFATNDTQRAAIASEAIRACRSGAVHDPGSVPLQYYLGLNLGQLARTKGIGALKLVREMETLWIGTLARDPGFDHAGADRCLGLLYLDAPGWPTSIGSHAKARTHLEHAVVVDPNFPENRLCLAETELKWKRPAAAAGQLRALDSLWPAAKTTWGGPEHVTAWKDWEQRRDRIRKACSRR